MKEIKKSKLSRRDFVKTAATGLGAATLTGIGGAGVAAALPAQVGVPRHWDREADVIVVGAGATGLPAAIQATQDGASVILIDANFDVGGHACVSGGNVALGGGTSRQKKYGIKDSPDTVFSDLTDWSVIEPNGFPDYRYNDREIIRAFADNSAPTYEWLVAQGVIFADQVPDRAAWAMLSATPLHAKIMLRPWPGRRLKPACRFPRRLQRRILPALASSVRSKPPPEKLGIPILLQHKMSGLVRENPNSGRVLGIAVTNQGKTLHFRARKGVVIGTGGHTGNVNFRRIFDPRLTEEYQVAARTLLFSGRQWRALRHGHRSLTLGRLQSDRRIRPAHYQARLHRLPIRLRQSHLGTQESRIFPRARQRPSRAGLSERNRGQSDGAALLR